MFDLKFRYPTVENNLYVHVHIVIMIAFSIIMTYFSFFFVPCTHMIMLPDQSVYLHAHMYMYVNNYAPVYVRT